MPYVWRAQSEQRSEFLMAVTSLNEKRSGFDRAFEKLCMLSLLKSVASPEIGGCFERYICTFGCFIDKNLGDFAGFVMNDGDT
jgi:hypothetical protein